MIALAVGLLTLATLINTILIGLLLRRVGRLELRQRIAIGPESWNGVIADQQELVRRLGQKLDGIEHAVERGARRGTGRAK